MPYKVPEVGRVTEVPAVVRRERALVGENVTVSPPPKVKELVAKVEVSETVRVLPAAMFKVLVPLLVMVKPLMVRAFRPLAMPTPPANCAAPVAVVVESLVSRKRTEPVVKSAELERRERLLPVEAEP